MSGSRVLTSGVGTAMDTQSTAASADSSVVAPSLPAFTSSATSAAGTSWMCDSPRLIRSTTRGLTSYPTTRKPARANSTARGSPT
jgi:hypothetical protein